MVALIVIGSIIAFFALILMLRVNLRLSLRGGEFKGSVRILFFKMSFPKQAAEAEPAPPEPEAQPEPEPKINPVKLIKGILAHLSEIVDFIKYTFKTVYRKVLKKMRIDLELHVKLATDDAANTAMAYGGASAAAYALAELLSRNFNMRSGRITITPDFNSTEPEIMLDAGVSTSIGGLVATGLAIIIYAMRNKSFELLNIVKGGA